VLGFPVLTHLLTPHEEAPSASAPNDIDPWKTLQEQRDQQERLEAPYGPSDEYQTR
jgi:hypothetical protein